MPLFAQQGRRVRRIGFLNPGNAASAASFLAAFRQGMTELHWVEGRDYTIDSRYASNLSEKVMGIASELVASKPDLLADECRSGDTSARSKH